MIVSHLYLLIRFSNTAVKKCDKITVSHLYLLTRFSNQMSA